MTRRNASVVAISAAVVIAAVLSLSALRAGQPGPGASPAPAASASPVATTPTAAVTPAGTTSPSPTAAAATDRYGYVFTAQEDRILVRRERDAAPVSMQGATSPAPGPAVFELAGVSPAVSSDGKRLAYWRTTPNVGATDLRVLDVANPTSDRSVLTLTGQTIGGAVVWSNDGQGLLIATYSRERTVGPGPESCPLQTDLLMIDLAVTPVAPRSAGRGGCVLLPVAWDRPGEFAAAVVTGPGGYAIEYLTWNGKAASPPTRAPIPRLVLASSVQASADAKLVMGLEDNQNVLRVWPIDDITKAESIRHSSRILSAFWRPGPTAPYEVIWTVGRNVDLFRYRTDSSTTLFAGTAEYTAALAVRPDGSGVLIAQSGGGPPPPTTRVAVVDVATRQPTDISTTVGSIQPLARGVLLR